MKNFISNVIILTGVTLACYLLVGQIVQINGESMNPTIKNNEWILAEKISPKFGEFKRGEIVVFKSPENNNRLLIKRIIGLPNETMEIKYGLVYIDGKLLNEPYLITDAVKENSEYKIGENEYVMLGDNRENSIDSREYGVVKKEGLLGRALFVYKPIQNFRLLLLLRE